jgi:hypothetical protein
LEQAEPVLPVGQKTGFDAMLSVVALGVAKSARPA